MTKSRQRIILKALFGGRPAQLNHLARLFVISLAMTRLVVTKASAPPIAPRNRT